MRPKQSSRVTKLFILHGGKMELKYCQENKQWIITDEYGNQYGFSSITEARDWMDHYENMKRYKERDKK